MGQGEGVNYNNTVMWTATFHFNCKFARIM